MSIDIFFDPCYYCAEHLQGRRMTMEIIERTIFEDDAVVKTIEIRVGDVRVVYREGDLSIGIRVGGDMSERLILDRLRHIGKTVGSEIIFGVEVKDPTVDLLIQIANTAAGVKTRENPKIPDKDVVWGRWLEILNDLEVMSGLKRRSQWACAGALSGLLALNQRSIYRWMRGETIPDSLSRTKLFEYAKTLGKEAEIAGRLQAIDALLE